MCQIEIQGQKEEGFAWSTRRPSERKKKKKFHKFYGIIKAEIETSSMFTFSIR